MSKGIITSSLEKFKAFLSKERNKEGVSIHPSQKKENGRVIYAARVVPKKKI